LKLERHNFIPSPTRALLASIGKFLGLFFFRGELGFVRFAFAILFFVGHDGGLSIKRWMEISDRVVVRIQGSVNRKYFGFGFLASKSFQLVNKRKARKSASGNEVPWCVGMVTHRWRRAADPLGIGVD
jgi:hypothetical protein